MNEALVVRTVPGKRSLQFKVDNHHCVVSTIKGCSKCYRHTAVDLQSDWVGGNFWESGTEAREYHAKVLASGKRNL